MAKKPVLSETKSTGQTTSNSGNSGSIHAPAIGPPRRWSQLYKIPIKNLLRSGPRGSGGANHGGAGAAGGPAPIMSPRGPDDEKAPASGGRSPYLDNSSTTNGSGSGHDLQQSQQTRGIPNRKPSPAVVEGQNVFVNSGIYPQSALPGHMIVRGSVGSDSGWSSSQGRYSTASSVEVDCSSPPSPGGESSGDVLL